MYVSIVEEIYIHIYIIIILYLCLGEPSSLKKEMIARHDIFIIVVKYIKKKRGNTHIFFFFCKVLLQKFCEPNLTLFCLFFSFTKCHEICKQAERSNWKLCPPKINWKCCICCWASRIHKEGGLYEHSHKNNIYW